MFNMKKIALYLILGFIISGCATTSKGVKSASIEKTPTVAIIEERALSGNDALARGKAAKDRIAVKDAITPIKITYSQITNLISNFLNIQSIEDPSKEPRFLGTSEDNLVTLEVVGNKDNISWAAIKLFYPKDIEIVNADLNNAMMLRFLRNAAPEVKEWPASVKGIIDKFHSMQRGNIEEDRISLGEKIIEILYNKNTDSITVAVKPR